MEQKSEPYLELQAEHKVEVLAHAVDIRLNIRGTSVITGTAALKKAKEVNRLVQALQQAGAEESAIRLRGVQAKLSSGLLGKSSEAEYALVVRCQNLELLGEWLGIISSQDNVEVEHLDWLFPEMDLTLLERGTQKLAERAKAMAQGLGVSLGTVIFCRTIDTVHSVPYEAPAMFSGQMARAKTAPVKLEFQLQQIQTQKITVQGRFAVL